MKRLVVAAGLAVVLGAAACSSSTGGAGEPVGINKSASSSASGSTSASRSASATPSASSPVSATAATVAPPPPPPKTTAAATPTTPSPSTSAPTPTPSTTVPAQIATSESVGVCNGKTTGMSNGNITVSWTTLGADQVYLKTGSTAGSLVGANAKDGGVGPLPASGSTTLTGAFNCGDMYGYVLIQPFKSDGSGSAGVVQQAPRN